MRRGLGVVAAMAVVAGCQTTQIKPDERSVLINATMADFTNELLATTVPLGYTIKDQTPNMILLERVADREEDAGVRFLYGSGFNGFPAIRFRYQVVGQKPVTVYVSGSIVTNPGSGFEKETSLNNHRQTMDQAIDNLQRIAAKFDR